MYNLIIRTLFHLLDFYSVFLIFNWDFLCVGDDAADGDNNTDDDDNNKDGGKDNHSKDNRSH